ncbi:hypothetical protein NG791_26445 [Laspinema sp. D1]|uniref:hypothetical protein n=1 Tax=Laspinema palackyanum TaxID=3231601 RepID=UPI00347D055A|nr:hypothetical protein [Laspinema sp. D2b]
MMKIQLIFLIRTGLSFSWYYQPILPQKGDCHLELPDTDNEPLVYPDPFYEPSPEDIMMNFREASRYH